MADYWFDALIAAAATVTQEVPIDGQTGVWLKQGTTVISSGMKMTGVTVGDGQALYIYNRGRANSTNVSSGGIMYVSSGGVAIGASVYRNGSANVFGLLSGVSQLESAANVTVFKGGVVSSAFVLLGNLLVSSGGFAEDAVASGFAPTSRGILNLRAGGSMNRVTAQRAENGFLNGHVTNLLVSGGGAVAYLRSPCVASGVSVTSGTLIVQSGASALAVTSGAQAVVTVQSGGYIEYA